MKSFEKINRDEIYIGDVVKIGDILSRSSKWNGGFLFGQDEIEIAPHFYTNELKFYRKILYTPLLNCCDKICAYDLLYDSPSYTVLDTEWYENQWLQNEKLNPWPPSNQIVISNICNFGNYLKAMGYDESLNPKNILEIRKKIFGTKHLHYDRSFTYKLTYEESLKYWKILVNARDRYIREFILTRLGDMAKFHDEAFMSGYSYGIMELYKKFCEYYPENKFDRFEPSTMETKGNQKIILRNYSNN